MSSSDSEEYEVEKIVNKRKRGKVEEFLVRWKGYSSNYDSWEPKSNLSGCQSVINQYYTESRKKENARRQSASNKQLYAKPYSKHVRSAKVIPLGRSVSPIRNRSLRFEPYKEKVVVHRMKTNLRIDGNRSVFNMGNSLKQPSTKVLVTGTTVAGVATVAPISTVKSTKSQTQKIFTVNGKKQIAQKWGNFPGTKSISRDHDYITVFPPQYGSVIPKSPLTFQAPQTEKENVLSGTRKSTLRKGRLFQDRLVMLQWRNDFVEIIFANTQRDNSLTPRFLGELSNALDAVIASKCSVVVVNTVGRVFCSGMDANFLIDTLSSSKFVPDTAKYLANAVRNFVDKLIEFPKILIAIVQGPAIGLGCAMLPLFDMVYCSDKAWFSTPYTDMGQTPECCSSVLFPEILGMITANKMLLIGARLTAQEAKERGLITEVFRHDKLKQHAMACIAQIASKNGEALELSKSLLRNNHILRLKHTNYCECNELAERWSSQDAVANLRRFLHSTNS